MSSGSHKKLNAQFYRPSWKALSALVCRPGAIQADWFGVGLVACFVFFFAGTALFLSSSSVSVVLREFTASFRTESGLAAFKDQYRSRRYQGTDHIFLAQIITAHTSGAKYGVNQAKLAEAILRESSRAGVDPMLIAAIIKAESTFNHRAVSKRGALGLMQIMPATGKYISSKAQLNWYGTHSLHDVEYNIRLGIAYLKYLEAKYGGNLEKALIAYNWGPGNLAKAQKSGGYSIPKSSIHYARSIISNHRRWKEALRNNYLQAYQGGASTLS